MTLEVGVLGPLEARREGEELALGGPQQRRLLGVLVAAAGQVVPVDRLIEAVWPDDPPDGARRSVLTYVSRLRLALGDGSLVTQDPGYRLDVAGDGVDAARFEGLVTQARAVPPTHALTLLDAALALWRGRAYGEFAEEWWALPHATRLDELRIAAAEQRADALLAVGEVDRAVAELEGLVAELPLREGPVTRLMTAHAAAGRQAEALRTADAFRKRLAEETGLDPSGELGALEASILAERSGGTGPTRSTRGYALGAAIGEGAFGTVYRSTQPGIGREVAVKVIRAELADDPGFVRRFEAEAQLVANLEHPHIVPLYDFWREPGGAYLVFRLLRGGTAADLVEREGPLDLERVDRLVSEIGSALATAHAAGAVHRDVKPSNILFDEAGNAYLTDFGVAAAVGDVAEPWPDGTGSSDSPRYAAPEQLQGSGATPRVDLYGLATMVWELLVGWPPFDGPTVSAILQTKLEGPVPALGRSRPDLPAALGDVLRRATATPPEDRYADVPAFRDAWHRACRVPAASPRRRERGRVTNPYKGLRAFGEADARDYRGRETLVAGLDDAVRDRRFVAVVGPSGSGKSSLVLAGLVPWLRAAGMRVVSMVPGDSPVANLSTALLAVAVEPPAAGGVEGMLRSVGGQPGGPLVLLVDQLEELWTLTADAERDTFVAGLAALAADIGTDIRIVATLRADFFDRPLAHPTLGPLVGTGVFAITPMTEAELHDAVVEPASARGVAFESGLDRAIVAEVANQPASLPLLQFTLAELFERRRGSVVTWDAYQAMGGLAGAIASRAEAVWSTLDDVERDACRRLLCRLVVPGEGTEDTRRRLRYSELPPGTPAVAAVLEAGRLLVGDHDPATREPTVEVAHESLLRSWPRLRSWLIEDRDVIRRVHHLGLAAEAWDAAGRPESELYRGARLEGAEQVLASDPDQLSGLEREFVEAGSTAHAAAQARARRARRRLRRGVVATSTALVVALIAGAVALAQRQDADRQAEAADVARLVSLSQSLTGSKRDVALLLALEAHRREANEATTSALEAAFLSDLSFLRYLHTGDQPAQTVAFSPDGRMLLLVSLTPGAAPVRVDVDTGEAAEVPIDDLGDGVVGWAVPLDGASALLAVGDDVERVDLGDGRVLDQVALGEETVSAVLSPDGRRVAVTTWGSTDGPGRVVILDTGSLDVVASVAEPGPPEDHFFTVPAWVGPDRLAVGSPSGRLLLWSPDGSGEPQLLNDPPAGETDGVFSVRAVPGRSTIVVTAASGVMAYDLATGVAAWPEAQPAGFAVAVDARNGVVWAQEAGPGSSRMFAYDLATGVRLSGQLDGQHGTVCDAHVSPDGTTIALASCNEGTVALWALDGTTPTGAPLESAGWATSLDLWSPDGRYVVLFRVDDPSAVEIADLEDGTTRPVPGIEASAVDAPIWRPDGLLQALVERTNHVVLFDPATGRTRDTGAVLPRGDLVSNVARHGSLSLYGMRGGAINVVDADAGRVVRTIETDLIDVLGIGWSPDGRRIFAAGQTEQAEVFDATTGERLETLPGPVANLFVSPDGSVMATAAFNGTLRFFDPSTLEPLGDPVTGVAAFPAQLQFTPDGRTLVASGLDNTMRFFDVTTRREVGSPLAITTWGASISPDSDTIAISTDRGVQRLSIDGDDLARVVCRVAGRDLTAAEWAQYIGGHQHRLCPS